MNNKLKQPPKSICIVRLSAIGDVCLMIPLVNLLQKHLPDAQITWVISNPAYQLVQGMPGIDFIVIDKPTSLSDYSQLYKLLRPYKFDALLATQANMRVNLIYPAIKAPLKIGFDKQRARDLQSLFTNDKIEFKKQHLLDSFLSFAKKLGINDPLDSPQWQIPLTDADIKIASNILSTVKTKYCIAINPITSKQERNWPLDRYATLIDAIFDKYDCSVIIIGGPDIKELKQIDTILAETSNTKKNNDRTINCAGKLSLKQLAALLKQVDCLISPDTAAVHIASAVKTDVIGLYAVASPDLSGPYFSKHLIIDKFPTAVQEILGKDPQNTPWKTRVHGARAMELIQVEEVMQKIAVVIDTEAVS